MEPSVTEKMEASKSPHRGRTAPGSAQPNYRGGLPYLLRLPMRSAPSHLDRLVFRTVPVGTRRAARLSSMGAPLAAQEWGTPQKSVPRLFYRRVADRSEVEQFSMTPQRAATRRDDSGRDRFRRERTDGTVRRAAMKEAAHVPNHVFAMPRTRNHCNWGRTCRSQRATGAP